MKHYIIKVETKYPIALDSPDHTHPLGTKQDNSKNPFFNKRLYELLDERGFDKPYCVCDFGCAGGGLVEDIVNDGHIGLGLEGSNWSQQRNRAAWGTIPANLFTCDLTKPFEIVAILDEPMQIDSTPFDKVTVLFAAITAWEFMEHIQEKDHKQLFENIEKHLDDDGVFICSVATFHGAPHHQCVHPKEWWYNRVRQFGFKNNSELVKWFDKPSTHKSGRCWVRDNALKPGNLGFNMVLERM